MNAKNQNNNEISPRIDNYLHNVYFDASSPGSFSGLDKIWSHVLQDPEKPKGLTKKKLQVWLNRQEVYQVYKPAKTKSITESVVTDHCDEIWEVDLLILKNDRPKLNKEIRFLLGAIDTFSRKVWIRLLRRKTAEECAKAFKSILAEGRRCESLRSDAGSEFWGKAFQNMLKRENIPHFKAYGSVKCSFIERWFRTFQSRLYRYAYKNNTSKFVDIAQDIVHSYNNTKHSITGYKPSEVNDKNGLALYDKVYTPILNKRAREQLVSSFAVGDLVRISLSKEPFNKHSYTASWSEEIFIVYAVFKTHPIRLKIRDIALENIAGSFYQNELKKANAKDIGEINWKIERIVSRKVVKGVKKSLVRWFGFPKKFSTWVNDSDLSKYPRRQ